MNILLVEDNKIKKVSIEHSLYKIDPTTRIRTFGNLADAEHFVEENSDLIDLLIIAVLITLFIAPMWINFVLRTGATRDLLTFLGINGGSYPYLATLIGMVQNYLPFVILPLYTTMTELDQNQIEAARDLGASPAQVFFKNIIPQAVPGIVSACLMTFMPTMSSYVISDTLSEGKVTLFGSYIELEFTNKAWHDGSFMALVMLVLIAVTMFISQRFGKEDERGQSAW